MPVIQGSELVASRRLFGNQADAPTIPPGRARLEHPIPIGRGRAHVWAQPGGSPMTPNSANVTRNVGKLDVADLQRKASLADPLPLRARIQIANRDHQLRPLDVTPIG